MQPKATAVVIFASLMFVSGMEGSADEIIERHRSWKRNIGDLGITKVFNGEPGSREFPWMVLITVFRNSDKFQVSKTYQCGGALIHRKVVLTAAHCVCGEVVSSILTRAGKWNASTMNETLRYQNRRVIEVITHEDYFAGGEYNDIALLIVQHPFIFGSNSFITFLPKQSEVIVDRKCVVTGWVKHSLNNLMDHQVLNNLELLIVDRKKCQDVLRKTWFRPNFLLHESFVCAGGIAKKPICQVYDGSPLLCPVPGRKMHYQLVGVFSWTTGCSATTPAVFVNVAMFRDWINCHLKKYEI